MDAFSSRKVGLENTPILGLDFQNIRSKKGRYVSIITNDRKCPFISGIQAYVSHIPHSAQIKVLIEYNGMMINIQ